ncbi:hypothetical protein V6N13_096188 [Hibiscus sabdariffa]|uniref:Uncharacterized protein n=1 Tax=Hibiscus sabdariffa TaxID=183260 RepID=A0ABR1ZF79_9ROSI
MAIKVVVEIENCKSELARIRKKMDELKESLCRERSTRLETDNFMEEFDGYVDKCERCPGSHRVIGLEECRLHCCWEVVDGVCEGPLDPVKDFPRKNPRAASIVADVPDAMSKNLQQLVFSRECFDIS